MPPSAWLLPSHPSFPNRISSVPFGRHRASPRITVNGDALFESSPFYSSNLIRFPFKFGSENQVCIAYGPIIFPIIFPFTILGGNDV